MQHSIQCCILVFRLATMKKLGIGPSIIIYVDRTTYIIILVHVHVLVLKARHLSGSLVRFA